MKLVIGTAQFGMSYGISNNTGKMHEIDVEKVIQYASRHEVNMLDTAPSYGNSESVVGKFINTHSESLHWNIITKTPYFKSSAIGIEQINELLKTFKVSISRLGKDSIYGLLVHNCNNIFLPGGEKLLSTLSKLKKDGFIEKIGVSLYSGVQIDRILDNYSIDLVQLPLNILDQRLLQGGQIKRLKKYNVEIHARSSFLQGLLLMPISNIPAWFNPIKNILNDFHAEAKERGISALQLAIGFVQSIDEVDKVVVGATTIDQFYEIINASKVHVNVDDFSKLSINNQSFLNPSKWKV
jgi:aryl-alcohol dehydrogenase-like predicted oxidoreductase